MNKVIWKYTIKIQDEFQVDMPNGAKVLYTDTQYGEPCMWVEVNPDAEITSYTFYVFGTGHHRIPTHIQYIGSFLMRDDALVWHLYT